MLAVNTSIYGFIGMKIAHAPGLYPLITDCDYMLSRIHIFFSLSIDTVNGRTCMMHVYENAHIFRQTGITPFQTTRFVSISVYNLPDHVFRNVI